MTLAELVKHRRDEGGMSLQRVAEEAGVSKQYVSDIEKGVVKNPSVKVLVGLAKALGVTEKQMVDAAKAGGF